MHEDLSRKEEIEGSSDRSFGIVMSAVFAIIGVLPLWHGDIGALRWWAIVVGAIFLLLALLRPAILHPLNRLWLKLGLLLAAVVSPIILALLFFVTVTPVGLLMRAFGKDPMRLRRDPNADSYWIAREPPGPAPDSMTRQF